jgi:tripartite-type tricarboxylate transporter receptor subunit TctC
VRGQVLASTYFYRASLNVYALLLANLPNAIAPSVAAKLPYTDFTDFAPAAEIMSISLMLATSPATCIMNFKNLTSKLRWD